MRRLGSRAAFLFCYYFWKDPITCFSCPCSGPEIWLEYAQYSIGGIGQEGGIEKVRSIFERALTAVGLHVTKGTALWEAYREFENAILETAQVSPFPWAPIPKKKKKICGAAPGVTWSCPFWKRAWHMSHSCFFPALCSRKTILCVFG